VPQVRLGKDRVPIKMTFRRGNRQRVATLFYPHLIDLDKDKEKRL
jgi:hypothetical protein